MKSMMIHDDKDEYGMYELIWDINYLYSKFYLNRLNSYGDTW